MSLFRFETGICVLSLQQTGKGPIVADFVDRIIRPERDDYIIRDLFDIDFYKLPMGQMIHRYHPGIRVKFTLINRHKHIPIARIVDEGELRRQLDHVMRLEFKKTHVSYLRGQDVYNTNMFSEQYLGFLASLKLPHYTLTRVDDQFELEVTDSWSRSTWWETIFMSVISELIYRKLMETMTKTELRVLFGRATDKLYRKLKRLKEARVSFADFSTRRRFSHLWQKFCIEMAQEVMGDLFTGTSNVWMAFSEDLMPIGTNAHELPMVLTAVAKTDEEKRNAQYQVVREWQSLDPRGGLRIVLPDTYGSRQFFNGMPQDLAEEVAHNWLGQRQDSGDPVDEAFFFMDWLKRFGVDAGRDGKVIIPSDGLDVEPMLNIHEKLSGLIRHPFGYGSMFGNDFVGCHPRGDQQAVVNGMILPGLTYNDVFRPHSIVCKPTRANGHPVVKLSNNPQKATGPRDEVEKYLRIFGHEGQVSQAVEV